MNAKSTAAEVLAAAQGRQIMALQMVSQMKSGMRAGVAPEAILASMQKILAETKIECETLENTNRTKLP